MEYIKLGKSSLEISKITFGCWAIAGSKEWGRNFSEESYINTLRLAYEKGINCFDTAQGYGSGNSEIVLGKAIKNIRDNIYISSKSGAGSLLKTNAEATIDLSLKRLDTDYIDIFFVHWPNPNVDIRENIEQLMKLKEKGKIKAIGVSNYTKKHLEIAIKEGQIDAFQPHYNLFWRHIEKDSLTFCRENNIGVMSYSSIAQGLLTGKFTKDWVFDENDMRNGTEALFKKDVFNEAVECVDLLRPIALKYNKTLAQLSINWLINQKGMTSAIVGAKTIKQLEDNIQSVGWVIEESDMKKIGDICLPVYNMVSNWDTMYNENDNRLIIK